MRRAPSTAHVLACVSLAACACGGPSVDRPDGGSVFTIDGSTAPPAPPRLDPVAPRVPYAVATLRGSAAGRRVIVEGGRNPVAKTVLPDGTFCVDVALPEVGLYAFSAYAQGQDGLLSEPAGPVEVERDPTAPPILGLQTCSGAHPAECTNAMEVCGNGRDDDCNNLIDAQDPACATCTNDPLEPNNDTSAPRIEPRRYDGLMICPGDRDYYGVFARADQTIQARIFFDHEAGNLDMHLLGVDRRAVLARSTSLTDDESLTFTATTTGQHVLFVFSDSGDSNGYVLELGVQSGG